MFGIIEELSSQIFFCLHVEGTAQCNVLNTFCSHGNHIHAHTHTRMHVCAGVSLSNPQDAVGYNAFCSVCLCECVRNSLLKSLVLWKSVDWLTVQQQKQSSQTVACLFICPVDFITAASRQQCRCPNELKLKSVYYTHKQTERETHRHTHAETSARAHTTATILSLKENNLLPTPPSKHCPLLEDF